MLLAAGEAVIVIGLTGSETDGDTFSKLASQTQTLLVQRGIEHPQILQTSGSARLTRDAILAGIRDAAGRVKANDEFWLVLFGHAGVAASGSPAFQVSGPRVTADDLRDALRSISAKKFVFVGTENSGAFLPLIAQPDCVALAATAESGEVNQPRFPEQWVEAFAENPKASFAAIAARASELVEKQYGELAVAQGEHARLADPASQKILEPPFGIADVAKAMAKNDAPSKITAVKPTGIEVTTEKKNATAKTLPPTDETRAIIAEARSAPNADHYPALMLREEMGFTVNSDRSTVTTALQRIYLASEEAVKTWADITVSSSAPVSITRVTSARTILPDGSSAVLDTEENAPQPIDDGIGGESYQTLHLPNARAGCVIEIATRTENLPGGALPIFYEEMEIQRPMPVLAAEVTLKIPKEQKFHFQLKNSDAKPAESETEHSKVLAWKFSNLPAFEPLPLDPPRREVVVALGVSSLESWDDFATWFRRIAKDSDAEDAGVKKQAEEIAAKHKTDTEKIKAAFEFVSSLRYVAIEFGIHGFRPRTPGQVLRNRFGDCKDKANLLVALLREMKIPAHFVLLNRMSSTDVNFPGWQFNHAIAMVSKGSALGVDEDLWLDSTDTTTPYGFVPPGDLGRNGLVFDKKSADFKTVASQKTSVTTIEETWTVEQTKDGKWSGTFIQRSTGLADYEQRQQLGEMTPQQRSFAFHQKLDALESDAEFDALEYSDISDLALPVELKSRWKSERTPVFKPGFRFLPFFAAPTRNRPLEINDDQPITYRQTVRLLNAPKGELPPETRLEAAGETMSIQYHWIEPNTLERVATCEIREPRVAADKYAELRSALRKWNQQLQQPL
jgi:transglutaminase-like putative cysteine protease